MPRANLLHRKCAYHAMAPAGPIAWVHSDTGTAAMHQQSQIRALTAMIAKSLDLADKLGLALVAVRLSEALDLIAPERNSRSH